MLGLSRWESVFVQTSVDLASGIELPPCSFVEDPQGADVLLVDANHRKYVSFDDDEDCVKPVVVAFTEDSDPDSADHDLIRPVGYASLISMLKEIENELHSVATPATEDSDRAGSAPQPEQEAGDVPAQATPEPVEANVQELRGPTPPEHVETIVHEQPKQQHLPSVEDTARVTEDVRPQPQIVRIEPDPAVTKLLIYKNGRASETLEEKARPARRFVEGTRLLGVLNRISRWRIPAEVTHIEFPTLLISPENNAFVAADDALSMPAMFRDSAMSFAIEDLPEDVAEAMLTSGRLRPLSHLIYCAALFGSEGRLMLNSNPEDRLSLIGTPNFNVVPHLPEHKTIARYMMTEDADLAGIAGETGVGVSIVIDFCNACEAIGLVRRVPGSGFKQSTGESGVQQLLGRVRDMFRDS